MSWYEDAQEKIDALTPVAAALYHETNGLNATISAVEERLKKLNLGVEAWVPLIDEPAVHTPLETSGTVVMLGFVPYAATWRLMLGGARACPVLDANCGLRCLAALAIPRLVKQLHKAAVDLLKDMEEAGK